MANKSIVIFSGYNPRAIISFCRVAEKQNIPLIIIAKSKDDNILRTKYEKYVKYIRENTELNLYYIKEILLTIIKKEVFDEYIILPSSEALNRFLLDNREELEKFNCIVPLVDKKIYDLVSDKYSFGQLCMNKDIRVPLELDFNENIEFPAVIKPKKYFTSSGTIIPPQIIKNKEELKKFIVDNNKKDFYIQKYVDGESYYLLYYFCKDGSYSSFSQKNILQQSKGKSMIAAVPAEIHKKEISNIFVELFKKIEFKGLIMVEIKYYNQEYFMIEANPRLWGPSQLFVDCGCEFFELFLKDLGFNIYTNNNLHPKTDVKYFWFGGLLESLYKFHEITFHTKDANLIKREFLNFLLNDIYLREDTKEIFTKEILHFKGED